MCNLYVACFNKHYNWGGKQVDILIVYNHGGIEYADVPLPEWREVYQSWIDLGVDAVIASHPHVPQGVEIYKGKTICYSLGNFCFDTLRKTAPLHWYESLCCVLETKKAHEVAIEIRPLIYSQKEGYVCDNESSEFERHLCYLSDILKDEEVYLNEVNKAVTALSTNYRNLFSRSGYIRNIWNKDFLKGFVEGFMGKGFWSSSYFINNIRCESHRWAILRAMDLKNKK